MLNRFLRAGPDENRIWFFGGLALILLTFTAFCAMQWTQPAIEDEFIQQKCALIWLAKGADSYELVHTPLMHELTSVWQKIFGAATPDRPQNVAILRSFGVFTAWLTALVFLWGLFRLPRKKTIGSLASAPVLALAILVLHPFFVQSALLMEYDSTVLPAPLLLAAILIEIWDRQSKPRRLLTLAISAVLALALFGKELTPVVFFPLWIGWAATRRWRTGRSSPAHITLACVGVVLALFGLWVFLSVWAGLRGFHWYDPLLTTRNKFFGRAESGGLLPWHTWGWSRFLFLTYIPFLWIGLPTFFSFITLALQSRGKRWLQEIPFSLWAAVAIFAMYTWLVQAAFYYPKYSAPAWPLLIFGASQIISISTPTQKVKGFKWFAVALLAGLFGAGLSPWLDPIMIVESRSDLSVQVVALHVVALLVPTVFLWSLLQRRNLSWFALLGLLALFVGTDLSHLSRNHSTRYLYGEHGFRETILALRQLHSRVSPLEPILTPARDVDWALGDQVSRYWNFEKNDPEVVPPATRIVASRTYGEFSVAGTSRFYAQVMAAFPCHTTNLEIGHRFEWWWKPLPDQDCDGNAVP